jgi:hypothetical protein
MTAQDARLQRVVNSGMCAVIEDVNQLEEK